jgi:site-specific DNA-methyltransferase (cytosine-N4-specific)
MGGTMSLQTLQGDCRDTLKSIPAGTVQMCVTSPPYWQLRSYLPKGHPDKAREIGQEKTPEAFVETMVQVFREVRRCLHETGTLWLNIGDSYAGGGGFSPDSPSNLAGSKQSKSLGSVAGIAKVPSGLKPKDLCMIPWRVALALQADGWWLRSVICWHKKSCMPESVTDRPTNSWEPIFLLAKSQRYFYDAESVKEPNADPLRTDYTPGKRAYAEGNMEQCPGDRTRRNDGFQKYKDGEQCNGRNQRNVWTIPEPMATLRSDLTDEQRLYVATELAKRGLL